MASSILAVNLSNSFPRWVGPGGFSKAPGLLDFLSQHSGGDAQAGVIRVTPAHGLMGRSEEPEQSPSTHRITRTPRQQPRPIPQDDDSDFVTEPGYPFDPDHDDVGGES
jgi:hypothetical protein